MAKKSARKEITKINLKQAALEGLSYERACETAKRAGKPSYRFTVGDKVQVGHLLNCVVDEALEGGYMYLIRSGANSDNYSCWAWTNVRPLDDDKDTHFAKRNSALSGGSISTEDGSFHSVRNGMTKALHEYLVKTTVLEPEYLEDPDRNKLAYVMAVGKYVYGEEDNKTEETFSGYFKRFDDTLTVEFLVNPSHWAESVVAELDKRTELYDGLNFSAGSGKDLIAVQRLVEQYIKQFESNPNCWESEYKKLLDAVSGCKNVRLILEGNGKQLSVQYSVSSLKLYQAVTDKQISVFPISPIKTRNEVQKFVNSIFPKVGYSIPIKMISRVESGRKVLWENPCFEGDRK